jgi:hypothetical protein
VVRNTIRVAVLVASLCVASAGEARVNSLASLSRLISQNRNALKQAAAQGVLEVARSATHRLLVDAEGKISYQAIGATSHPRAARWRWLLARRHFTDVSDEQLAAAFRARVLPTPLLAIKHVAPIEPRAILPDGRAVKPDGYGGGFHGTQLAPDVVLRRGLPPRGDDWRLLEHSEQRGRSAFRGVTEVVADPVSRNGAAYWADVDGWVYEIRGVAGWNVNALLEGRVPVPGGYRGNLMRGEQETAIVGQVPPERIKAYGRVEEDGSGRLYVRRWIANPAYQELGAARVAGIQ